MERIRFDRTEIGMEVTADLSKLARTFGNDMDKIPTEKIADFYKMSISEKLKKTAVTCFSLSKDIPLMWSHYGEKHTGICFEFSLDFETSPFKAIAFNKINFNYIDYDEKDPVNYLKNKTEGIFSLLFTKSIFWKYEEEYRMTSMVDEGYYEFEPSFISGVIFGLKFPEEDLQSFVDNIKNKIPNKIDFKKVEREVLDLKIKALKFENDKLI
jgi:hypothetical protein